MTTSVQAANSNNSKSSDTATASATTTATATTTAAAMVNGIKAELTPPPLAAVGIVAAAAGFTQHSPIPAASIGCSAVQQQLQVATPLSNTVTPTSSSNRVMQADEDFNIRFVNLVRLHRCLYDKKVPEYRNRDNQEKAWVLISQETRENVIHCKERWRNLRACLSRYIKQQSGSEPQHKPYYLTEHMAFLLPFLKSARSTLDGNNSLATLYQLSQQDSHLHLAANSLHLLNAAATHHHTLQHSSEMAQQKLELKHSLSENDDEETMDAFDPAITASLGLQRVPAAPSGVVSCGDAAGSPAPSDTASANSMQNFIPDVQLAESGQDLIYQSHMHHTHPHHHHHHHQHHHRRSDSLEFEDCSSPPLKRIKTECEATTSGQYYGLGGAENADMEFFRSILPDLAALTPQQKRKFKIGILELIDDVVDRYPASGLDRSGSSTTGDMYNGLANGSSNGLGASTSADRLGRQQRRSSVRDSWRK